MTPATSTSRTGRTRTYQDCAICDQPMKPGQRQKALPGGSRGHAVCVETATPDELGTRRVTRLEDPDVRDDISKGDIDANARQMTDDEFEALVMSMVAPIVEARVKEEVAVALDVQLREPTEPAGPPSKSAQLAELMKDAGDRLMRRTIIEAGTNVHLFDADIREMSRAATVLRVVAIYIAEAP